MNLACSLTLYDSAFTADNMHSPQAEAGTRVGVYIVTKDTFQTRQCNWWSVIWYVLD
jgi:hypothetical protein